MLTNQQYLLLEHNYILINNNIFRNQDEAEEHNVLDWH